MANRAEVLNYSYVRVSNDEMEAWLYLCEPADKSKYTKQELIDLLADNGVIAGLNQSNLAAMAKKGVYYREIKVAVGQDKVDGVDGYYVFAFTPENLAKTPTIREDGSVDYTSMKTLQNVRKGEKVAEYFPAVLGTDGFTVKGMELKAKYARELPPIGGRSAIHSEDNYNIYLAAMDGKIQIQDNKIDIQNVHQIDGDVDALTGKVEFYGDIIINGNVENGVVIRAGRNIVIKGNVEACTLFSGGDITLQRGIQGAEKGKVTAKGNVYADFIEYATISAGKNIHSNSVLNSQLTAGEKIVVDGKKGKLIGGYAHAAIGIEAQSLGNLSEVRTVVHTGFTEQDYSRLLQINKEEMKRMQELAGIAEEISNLSRNKTTGLSRFAEVRMAELVQRRETYKAEIEKLKAERTALKEKISEGRNSYILIKGRIERGVVICMENAKMPIDKGTSFTKYTVTNGVIDGEIIAI